MNNHPPLNPDALEAAATELFFTITAHKSAADVLGFDWKKLPTATRAPWETASSKVVAAYLSALPDPPEVWEAQAKNFMRVIDRLSAENEALKAAALPEVTSVEEVPAKLQIISWEEEPEHECWKLAPDETFVGLIVKSGRSWTPRDKYTLNIERPEVKP